MKTTAPGGTEWHVRRRWAPRHLGSDTVWSRFVRRSRNVREHTSELADVPDPGCTVDIFEGIAVFLLVVVVVVFLIFFGIPFLVALGELLFVLLAALAGLIGRVLFRRPWTVDAVSATREHHVWSVVGWRASGAARQFIADRIAGTGTPPSSDEVAAASF